MYADVVGNVVGKYNKSVRTRDSRHYASGIQSDGSAQTSLVHRNKSVEWNIYVNALPYDNICFPITNGPKLHISFWRAFSLYLTSAADLNSLVLLPGGLLWMPY